MGAPLKLVVLASGRGSNLEALLAAIDRGACAATISAVLSDRADAPALALAAARGIATERVLPKSYASRPDWDRALAAQMSAHAPDLVVLAGFMRLVGSAVLAAFPGRIINVHPALLPAFPGLDAAEQAVRARVCISGCTVHVVDAGVDTGPVLAQAAVPVHGDDDGASLHARIQTAEHALLPAVVHAIATGVLVLGSPPRFAGSTETATGPLVWPPVL